jgi:hypothetical protein
MSNTANLVLPYLAVGQAQKHVTVNESLRKLDAIIQLSVVSATTSAEPSTPTDGEVYIVPSGKSGAHWSTFANGSLGYYRDGAWTEITPREGWLAFVRDTDQLLAYTGSAWSLFAPGKLITVSATDKVLGRSTSGAGAAEEIACTAAGRALIDDADAAAQRATLGLGTAALSADSTLMHLAGTETVTGAKTFGSGSAYCELNINGNGSGAGGGALLLIRTAGTPRVALGNMSTITGGAFDAGGVLYSAGALTIMETGGVVISGASGGFKGSGTLNAAGVYDDNVLLSCYVFDQALDGAIDMPKWDAKVPEREIPAVTMETEEAQRVEISPARTEQRIHDAARRFAERAGTKHDPLTLDGYAAHWKEKRHLSSMPNEEAFDPESGMAMGAWTQRLIETVEIQAVLIEQLNERLKLVEATTRPG